jgi:cytochrome c oxidase assembly factor CtaG
VSPLQPSIENLLGRWSLDPVLTALLGVTAGLYLLGFARVRRRRPELRRRWPAGRAVSFIAGLATIAIALESGVDEIGDRELLCVHTAQHMLLALLAPALLLCGAPIRLTLAAGSHSLRASVTAVLSSTPARVLSRPVTGCTLFAAVMLLTHLRVVFEAALENPMLHALEHAAYFWSGLLLLAPLIAADPLPRPPGAVARFGWLMGAMTAMAIPGALLTFSERVSYPFYVARTRLLGRSPLADEHLGGAIMWVGGGLAMFTLAIALAYSTMRREEQLQRRRERYQPTAEADLRAGTVRL